MAFITCLQGRRKTHNNSSIDRISTVKIDEIQNNHLTQIPVFLAGVELKKINSC